MTNLSSKDESEERGNVVGLIQQFKNLEQEWKSLEKSRTIKNPNPRTYSATTTVSDNSCRSIITSFEQLLSNSPRELMSSLQQRDRSPSDVISRVKNCDAAVEEILGDRRAAITSGKIKGKRLLFSAEEKGSEEEIELNYGGDVGGEICSDCSSNTHGREVVIMDGNSSGEIVLGGENSFSDSSLTEEEAVVEEEQEKMVVEVTEKRGGDDRKKSRVGGRFVAAMAWFAFVLVLVTLGLISITCNGKYVQKNEFLLVPT